MARTRIPLDDHQTLVPPTASSYWVTPQLIGGCFPGPTDIQLLLTAGIRHFINLVETREAAVVPYEKELAGDAKYLNVPIGDLGVPSIETMSSILNTIDQAHKDGKVVYVHCLAGVGRTGVVVCCYLLRHKLATHRTVFHELQRMRLQDRKNGFRYSPQSSEQFAFVKRFNL